MGLQTLVAVQNMTIHLSFLFSSVTFSVNLDGFSHEPHLKMTSPEPNEDLNMLEGSWHFDNFICHVIYYKADLLYLRDLNL